MLIFNASIDAAHSVLERIRISIAEMIVNYENNTLKVTISSGLTVFQSSNKCNSQTLIDSADKALYQAKSNGRNRVVLA